jgi:septin family protein
MPYFIFSPETRDGVPGLVREYPWGDANVMDPAQSDFVALRNAVIGEFASVSHTCTLLEQLSSGS